MFDQGTHVALREMLNLILDITFGTNLIDIYGYAPERERERERSRRGGNERVGEIVESHLLHRIRALLLLFRFSSQKQTRNSDSFSLLVISIGGASLS